ncbi:MAG TPA: hypothetical protein VIJ42_16285 [Stellaceae bacterium]
MDKRGGPDDGNAAKWVKNQQIAIIRDHHVGPSIYRQLKEFIVVGIAADLDPFNHLDQFGGLHHPRQTIGKIAVRKESCQSGFRQRSIKLLLRRGGLQESGIAFNPAKGEARRGISLQGGTDKDIGIDN